MKLAQGKVKENQAIGKTMRFIHLWYKDPILILSYAT